MSDTLPQIPPDLAAKVLAAEKRNAIKDVGDGGKLPTPIRKELQTAALTPDLAAQLRAGSLLTMFCDGEDLSVAQWEEIRAAHPGFAQAAPPPSAVAAEAEAFALATDLRPAKLTKADEERYSKLYGKQWRQIRRWIEIGAKADDPCPLHDPAKMPAWWGRHMKWRVPVEIEAAAVAAAQEVAHIPAPQPAMGPEPEIPAPRPASPSAPLQASTGKIIDLESYDPEDGDRLRELKQIQAAKFAQLKEALKAGQDCTVLEGKYLKLCETIDKIETRVADRLKKRGQLVLRDEVERDLAANAELMRQLDDSQERRVLERCPSLTEQQRTEVVEALRYSNRAKVRILSKLDSLSADDLLRELAA